MSKGLAFASGICDTSCLSTENVSLRSPSAPKPLGWPHLTWTPSDASSSSPALMGIATSPVLERTIPGRSLAVYALGSIMTNPCSRY